MNRSSGVGINIEKDSNMDNYLGCYDSTSMSGEVWHGETRWVNERYLMKSRRRGDSNRLGQ